MRPENNFVRSENIFVRLENITIEILLYFCKQKSLLNTNERN